MELDINPEWHTLITYTHHHGHLVPTMVEPQPMQSDTRYLTPDNRDFFAIYGRVAGPVTVPFKIELTEPPRSDRPPSSPFDCSLTTAVRRLNELASSADTARDSKPHSHNQA